MDIRRLCLTILCTLCWGITFMLLLTMFAAPSQALSPHSSAGYNDSAELRQAFTRSYSAPADVDAALYYAKTAIRLGDYESAIPPLERILMFNPALDEVRLEVGILYYLLGADIMADQHFTIVASSTNATAEVQSKAKRYLAQ